MIPIAKPNVGPEEEAALQEVAKSGIYAQGPRVQAFEEAFASYLGRRHAVAVNSGTAALHLTCLALNLGRQAEVIIPPLTFFASASAVLLAGGKVRFADVRRDTYNIDPDKVKRAIGSKTKAVMPVHLFGQTADMDPILEIAQERGVVVIEDACQAHGAAYKGRKAGALGDVACFSFYPTKNMTTGEGGMIVTDDEGVAERCRLLRDHGQRAKYDHVSLGYNYRMTEFAAAIGLVQLRKLDDFVEIRRRNAKMLTTRLKDIEGLTLPQEAEGCYHSFYQYIVRTENRFPLNRDELVRHLMDKRIGARPSYPKPLYKQEALRALGIRARCPVAEDVLPRLVELPVHPSLTDDDVKRVIAAVRSACGQAAL